MTRPVEFLDRPFELKKPGTPTVYGGKASHSAFVPLGVSILGRWAIRCGAINAGRAG